MIESRYTARAMRAFPALLDRPARGNSRVIGIPVFMDAKTYKPLLMKICDMDQKSGIQKQTKRSEKISLRKLGKKKARTWRAE